jgi:hypothetical protein
LNVKAKAGERPKKLASQLPLNQSDRLFSIFARPQYLTIFCVICAGALTPACSSLPSKGEKTVTGEVGTASGQWRGKALVKDLKKSKSGSLDLEIIAHEPSQLRMEIMGSFGVHVASVAMNGEKVQVLLTREKKFVTAPANEEGLSRLLPLKISPPDLLRVLFDRSLPKWKCQDTGPKNGGGERNCTNGDGNGQVTVKWQKQGEGRRRIQIGSAEAKADMVLQEAKAKVEVKDSAFELHAPSGFVSETLN